MQHDPSKTEAKPPNLEILFHSQAVRSLLTVRVPDAKQSSCNTTFPWYSGVRIYLDRWESQGYLKMSDIIKLKRLTLFSLKQFVTQNMGNGFRWNNRRNQTGIQMSVEFSIQTSVEFHCMPMSRCCSILPFPLHLPATKLLNSYSFYTKPITTVQRDESN